MDRREQVQYLNQTLLAEMPQYREQAEAFPVDAFSQRRLLRSLMNVRPPMPLAPKFLEVQDALLSAEREEKGVVNGDALPPTAGDPRLVLWQGDITRLRADAIVDADNSALLGPIVGRWVTWKDRRELAACYRSCLALAAEHDLRSVAFCCISTGEFHFPNQEAAEIAVRTVREFLEQQTTSVERVIFNVFKDLDAAIYRRLLGPD